MAVRWGADFVLIYNDGYLPMLGDKHPQALGIPFRDAWPELQEQFAPLHRAMLAGERGAFFAEDLALRITRHPTHHPLRFNRPVRFAYRSK